ncbi:hypothetical protein CSUI_006593, partial [Cystoisospora suis]
MRGKYALLLVLPGGLLRIPTYMRRHIESFIPSLLLGKRRTHFREREREKG